MSSIFRQPVKGELLWSAISRLLVRFPNISTREIPKILFGGNGHFVGKLFPRHINAYCDGLSHSQKSTPDTVLSENTMFPFVAPFVGPEMTGTLRTHLVGDERQKRISFCYSMIVSSVTTPLRYCPKCIGDDIQKLGVAVWRSIHQFWPLKICPHHECDLVSTDLFRTDNVYVSIGKAAKDIPQSTAIQASPLQTALARNLSELQANTIWEIGPEKIRSAFRIELQKSGRKTRGSGAYELLTTDLIKKFGEKDLAICNAKIVGKRAKWAKPIFVSTAGVPALLAHHCIILCVLIGISIRELIETAASVGESETGPWPCLSVGLTCSGKKVITRARGHCDKFHFACPHCRTHYFRQAPLVTNLDGSFEHQLSRGALRTISAHRFSAAWCDPKNNWESLKAQFGKQQSTIGLWAASFGLPDMPGRTLECFRRIAAARQARIEGETDRKLQEIAWKKNLLGTYIKGHPAVSYIQAPIEIRKLFNWLSYHGNERPPAFRVGTRRKGNLGRPPIGIASKDAEIADIFRAGAPQMISSLKRLWSPRVSLKKILRFYAAKVHFRAADLANMPLTQAVIDELVENPAQAWQRRVKQVVQFIDKTPALPKWYLLSQKCASMSPDHLAQVRAAYLKRHPIKPGWNTKRNRTIVTAPGSSKTGKMSSNSVSSQPKLTGRSAPPQPLNTPKTALISRIEIRPDLLRKSTF